MFNVLSRNKVHSITQISSKNPLEPMKKLNKRKIVWIVREVERRDTGLYTIARTQNVTPQHVCKVYRKFKNREPEFLPCGRKPSPLTNEERKLIKQTYETFHVSATAIEKILDEKGKHINHNRIHRIMLEEGLAKREPKKSRRRTWVRYERKHSNSLWHADWFVHKGKDCLLIIDDASRVLPHCKDYPDAKIDKSCEGFREALKKWGIPKQLMTDHGSNFATIEVEGLKKGDSEFTELLKEFGVKHIKARVKHPQSNGKAERAVGTIKRLWDQLGSLEAAVKLYNFIRPHMSLTNEKLRTPYQAFLEKQRKEK